MQFSQHREHESGQQVANIVEEQFAVNRHAPIFNALGAATVVRVTNMGGKSVLLLLEFGSAISHWRASRARYPSLQFRLMCSNFVPAIHQGGKVEVALEQRRYNAKVRIGVGKQLPCLVVYRGAMRVDSQVLGFDIVAGQVEVANPISRHFVQEFVCVVLVVDAVDDDVVDVEHQVAVGFFEYGERETPPHSSPYR